MTEKPFKASNGWTVQKGDGVHGLIEVRMGDGSFWQGVTPDTLKILTEYVQHGRDQELGRVRWPEDPDYVIYRVPEYDDEDGRCVQVFHEPTTNKETLWEWWSPEPRKPAVAALWFFTEGPGKPERPWEDAQAGEVWRLTVDGEEGNYLVKAGGEGPQYLSGQRDCFVVDHTRITAGRKLLEADGCVADG